MSIPTKQDAMKLLDIFDPEMADLLHREEKRQFETLTLIASENVVSPLALVWKVPSLQTRIPRATPANALSADASFPIRQRFWPLNA